MAATNAHMLSACGRLCDIYAVDHMYRTSLLLTPVLVWSREMQPERGPSKRRCLAASTRCRSWPWGPTRQPLTELRRRGGDRRHVNDRSGSRGRQRDRQEAQEKTNGHPSINDAALVAGFCRGQWCGGLQIRTGIIDKCRTNATLSTVIGIKL